MFLFLFQWKSELNYKTIKAVLTFFGFPFHIYDFLFFAKKISKFKKYACISLRSFLVLATLSKSPKNASLEHILKFNKIGSEYFPLNAMFISF